MGEIINLRLVRKAKARDAAAEAATANRALHGQSRDEKGRAQAERDRRDTLLDGSAIERNPPE